MRKFRSFLCPVLQLVAIFFISVTAMSAKPIVDLCDKNISNTSSIHKYSYDRPEFMWMCYGKNSHVVVLSDMCLNEVEKKRAEGYEKIVAYLMEPRAIFPEIYQFVVEHLSQFDLILTFDQELLTRYPDKCRFVHAVGWGTLYQQGIHKKSKMCSFMRSDKNSTEGHQLRHKVYEAYKQYFDGYKGGETRFARWKDQWVNDFYFSVIVENSRQSHYFTEKLTECFRAGTIPIYWGCPTIGQFFDLDGIITFTTLEELGEILKKLSFEEYEKRLFAIRNNFERVQSYPECYLHTYPDRPDSMDGAWKYLREYF